MCHTVTHGLRCARLLGVNSATSPMLDPGFNKSFLGKMVTNVENVEFHPSPELFLFAMALAYLWLLYIRLMAHIRINTISISYCLTSRTQCSVIIIGAVVSWLWRSFDFQPYYSRRRYTSLPILRVFQTGFVFEENPPSWFHPRMTRLVVITQLMEDWHVVIIIIVGGTYCVFLNPTSEWAFLK